jgi:membrane-bound serine protease (ClpP class)
VGLGVNPVVIFGSAAVTFGFFVFFVDRILRSRRQPVLTGPDALVGAPGEAREDLSPDGLVFVRGALWKAVAQSGPIPAGSPVQVVSRKGLRLEVVAGAAEVTEEKA